MTVTKIKEYIDEHIDDDEEVHTMQELRTLYGSTLDEIRSMLDELDKPMTNREYLNYKGITHTTLHSLDLDKPINLKDIKTIDLLDELKESKQC